MEEFCLETERLILRMFREEDFDAYAAMCADPEVMRYLGGKTLARAEAWRHMAAVLGHWQLRGYGLCAVVKRDTRKMIGRIGLWQPEGWPGFELGWCLIRSYWGKGYAFEGAHAMLHYAFTTMRKDHVISLIHPENALSIRLAERLGEHYEGATQVMGHPVLIYGIHAAERSF